LQVLIGNQKSVEIMLKASAFSAISTAYIAASLYIANFLLKLYYGTRVENEFGRSQTLRWLVPNLVGSCSLTKRKRALNC
jgi:hypothetical protein